MLRDKGYSEEEIQKVHSPIGLPIGSKTPYEIVVSILAEIILTLSSDKIQSPS